MVKLTFWLDFRRSRFWQAVSKTSSNADVRGHVQSLQRDNDSGGHARLFYGLVDNVGNVARGKIYPDQAESSCFRNRKASAEAALNL